MHPDIHISGNDRYLSLYEKYLKEMSKYENYWEALPREVASWWRERANLRIKDNKIQGKTSFKPVIKSFK